MAHTGREHRQVLDRARGDDYRVHGADDFDESDMLGRVTAERDRRLRPDYQAAAGSHQPGTNPIIDHSSAINDNKLLIDNDNQ